MNIKKGLLIGLAALGLSVSAQASNINVGGVTWDPDSTFAYPVLTDFISDAVAINLNTNDAFGVVQKINNVNPTDFCVGCELTFTVTKSIDAAATALAAPGVTVYDNFTMKFFVDNAMNFAGTKANAIDGNLWLELNSTVGITIDTLAGTASDVFLNVMGGLAAGNFDTNTVAGGADVIFKSHSISTADVQNITLAGDTIPEPTSIALLGLGLIGFAASRKRKA